MQQHSTLGSYVSTQHSWDLPLMPATCTETPALKMQEAKSSWSCSMVAEKSIEAFL